MRPPRIHVPGALYYLRNRSNGSRPLFECSADYESFKVALGAGARACGATLYAFCLEPHAFHLAVRVADVPTSRLMWQVARRHVECLHRRSEARGPLFVPHHRELLVDWSFLRELVRFVLWASVRASCAECLEEWPHSSHSAVTGDSSLRWIDTDELLRQFGAHTLAARARYRDFVRRPPPAFFSQGFERGLPGEPRAFGLPAFLERVGLAAPPALRQSLEDVAGKICRFCGISRAELMSARKCAGERALFTWYVEQQRIASLADIGRFLGKHGSTLRAAVEMHRAMSPELFDVQAIRRAQPIVPLAIALPRDVSPGDADDGWHSPASVLERRVLRIQQRPLPRFAPRRRRGGDF